MNSRHEQARGWHAIQHGPLTRNQKAVLCHLAFETAHFLSPGRYAQALRSLERRGLTQDGALTPEGRSYAGATR